MSFVSQDDWDGPEQEESTEKKVEIAVKTCESTRKHGCSLDDMLNSFNQFALRIDVRSLVIERVSPFLCFQLCFLVFVLEPL